MASLSICNSNSVNIHASRNRNSWHLSSIPLSGYTKTLNLSNFAARNQNKLVRSRRLTVFAVTEGSAKKSSKSEPEEQPIPSWAKPDSEEPPPWARNEAERSSSSSFELPFYVYLLSSAITAIAAIGSVFEYINQKPVFGVLDSDSIFYAPLLGFFAFTGIPTSGFLWFKSVQAANKEAEEQDRRDGYR